MSEVEAVRSIPKPFPKPFPKPGLAPETLAVQGNRPPEPTTGAILPPVFQNTTYRQQGVDAGGECTYSRAANPTVAALETALAAFEGLPEARAFATGMAAITTLMLSTLESGSHVVCSDVVYGGTVRLIEQILEPLGIESSFVDTSDVDALEEALRPETRLVFVETPANPTLKLTDLAAVGDLVGRHSAILAVDNTVLTAALQRPAELGADIVVYSTTKYIEGHNATVGGALVLRDEGLLERIDLVRKTTGSIQSPWEAWLTLKGLKTLTLRMERHSRSALEVATWLATRPEVQRVSYPFSASFAQHDLARRQQAAGGGIVSFELLGGVEAGKAFLAELELCHLAENLGAAETLITHPVTMTHADVDPEARRAVGITDGLIRLSVGLEAPEDLIADLAGALDAVGARVGVAL